jgi:predicted O-methyltransferase YrrM
MSERCMTHSLTEWIAQLFEHRELLRMGHGQRRDDLNLGLGWLYYALARVARPASAVVIGSYRGFVPLVLARALADNGEGGRVHFIDPSLVDDFWKDGQSVQTHFAGLGVTNIDHYLMTTQQFVEADAYDGLGGVGLVFIDGYHTAEQARFDFEAFAGKVPPTGLLLLHDSVWRTACGLYGPGRAYTHSVIDFVTELKHQPAWQVLDLPFGNGLTVVRRAVAPCAPPPPTAPSGAVRPVSHAFTAALAGPSP